tara:strand:- start:1910 stop:2146 length:237 start_codon:yes stop_codon:yes gene_type:complete
MTTKYDGGPAFPYPVHNDEGMSLRDYFAGQAIAGAALDPDGKRLDVTSYLCAYNAYQVADLMLAQRDFVAPIAEEGDG